jgi:hypothetical protein
MEAGGLSYVRFPTAETGHKSRYVLVDCMEFRIFVLGTSCFKKTSAANLWRPFQEKRHQAFIEIKNPMPIY